MPRRLITVQGLVQGVGFRPFIYRLATAHRLTGLVANTGGGVRIEAQGPEESLAGFARAIKEEAPPQSTITGLNQADLPLTEETVFRIVPSDPVGSAATLVAPDLRTCDDCLGELFEPSNRRYRYPFINCTNCGPRFTIITAIPYDRQATTMRQFRMCPACRREYEDPANRRFHAQPNACPDCGPRVWLCGPDGESLPGEAFAASARLLAQGRILAVKGLGGFHLAADPTNGAAVAELRRRKGRPHKPLALMVADLKAAEALCHLSPAARDLLLSPPRPIVLIPKRADAPVSPEVAPGVNELGLMLPYTPLHHLLLDAFGRPLVMTSANLSDEPLCRENQEALARLAGIADFFLLHDREIAHLADDSVLIPGPERRPHPLRRARGLAPAPIPLAESGPNVLAVGGELKNAICLTKDDLALISPHLGDLKNLAAHRLFAESILHLLNIFDGRPELIVCDLHPNYLSSQWARQNTGWPVLAAQHHHAHLVSCLAENRHPGPAIGVILDGTGLGEDGGIWGGEVLIGSAYGYTRYAHLEPLPLPGGEQAIREPWRTAVGYLVHVFGPNPPQLDFLASHDWRPVAEIAQRPRLSPATTSGGRLFDAVAAMTGGRQIISYEGQAAIELMAAAGPSPLANDDDYQLDLSGLAATRILPIGPLIRQVVADLKAGAKLPAISRRFHATLIKMLAQAVRLASAHCGLATVALSGGVFANSLLREGLSRVLAREGFTVLNHSLLPAGDGGLSLGQAMIGRAHLLTARKQAANQPGSINADGLAQR